MNSLFWTHVPTSIQVQKILKKEVISNPHKTTHDIFKLSGKNAQRVTDSPGAFSTHLKEFDNWTRLNCLVAILSYFETYLSSVTSLAIESDLGLLYSIPKKIDGITVLKYGSNDHSFPDKSELITKGTWNQRISNYRKIFNSVPPSLSSNIADLEKMRKTRNNVAHAFGRDINLSRARTTLKMLPIERLSLDRLQKYMKLIRTIAKEIDKQLFTTHIGEFELIHYYHFIKDSLNSPNQHKQLKTKINGLYTQNRNIKFCKELIHYYNSL